MLNENKSVSPNSFSTNNAKTDTNVKNDIALQMSNILNLSVSTGVFPSELKFVKFIPAIHKKESKLKYWNYGPISLLSTLDKILEKIMYNRIPDFLEKRKLIYLLHLLLDSIIQLPMHFSV